MSRSSGSIPAEILEALRAHPGNLSGGDFLATWDKDEDDLRAVLYTARLFREMRRGGLSPRVFDSGLAVSIFRDQSTRTRFSFASAADLLGLSVVDFEAEKSQIAHGETLRETITMISFLTEAIGIRDDIYLGAGHAYMQEVGRHLTRAFDDGVLPRRPTVVNLQSDIDHPTQSMSDLAHLADHFGSLDALRGKRIAVTWAHSPSYGKPLSVPQGLIALLPRFGMDVVLAHPPGYRLAEEVVQTAEKHAAASGSAFRVVESMEEAFRGADAVYPKSWAPYDVLERRTGLLQTGDQAGLKSLEVECLASNARHSDWECTEERMSLTRQGRALYMHCLPADISGENCRQGEVAETVFDRYRTATYKQAGHKPYIIAAMIFLAHFRDPAQVIDLCLHNPKPRLLYMQEE